MLTAQKHSARFTGLILFALAAGLLGSSGFAFAADRTVLGELFSRDG